MVLAFPTDGDVGQQPSNTSDTAEKAGSLASSPPAARICDLGPVWSLLGPDSFHTQAWTPLVA